MINRASVRRAGVRLMAGLAALTLVAAGCSDDDDPTVPGAGGDGGGGQIEALEGFVPVVDGEEQLGCGGYGFRPENKDFRDAFNAVLVDMKQNDEILPIVEEFGFSQADIDAAKDVTVSDLAADPIEGQSGGGLLEELKQAGTIKVGFAGEIPYGFEGDDGEPTGEAPEVARQVLAELGIEEMEGVVVEFGALINGLKTGEFHMIAAGMFINDERAQQILFTDPDYCATTALAVKAGNPHDLSDFDSIVANGDVKLGVLSGAVEDNYATGSGVPEGQIERYQTTADLFDALVADRVDAVALTSITVREQVERINS